MDSIQLMWLFLGVMVSWLLAALWAWRSTNRATAVFQDAEKAHKDAKAFRDEAMKMLDEAKGVSLDTNHMIECQQRSLKAWPNVVWHPIATCPREPDHGYLVVCDGSPFIMFWDDIHKTFTMDGEDFSPSLWMHLPKVDR